MWRNVLCVCTLEITNVSFENNISKNGTFAVLGNLQLFSVLFSLRIIHVACHFGTKWMESKERRREYNEMEKRSTHFEDAKKENIQHHFFFVRSIHFSLLRSIYLLKVNVASEIRKIMLSNLLIFILSKTPSIPLLLLSWMKNKFS
jgi:hypothetical protein